MFISTYCDTVKLVSSFHWPGEICYGSTRNCSMRKVPCCTTNRSVKAFTGWMSKK